MMMLQAEELGTTHGMVPLGGQHEFLHLPRWTRWLSALHNVSGHDDALICGAAPGRTAETIPYRATTTNPSCWRDRQAGKVRGFSPGIQMRAAPTSSAESWVSWYGAGGRRNLPIGKISEWSRAHRVAVLKVRSSSRTRFLTGLQGVPWKIDMSAWHSAGPIRPVHGAGDDGMPH